MKWMSNKKYKLSIKLNQKEDITKPQTRKNITYKQDMKINYQQIKR